MINNKRNRPRHRYIFLIIVMSLVTIGIVNDVSAEIDWSDVVNHSMDSIAVVQCKDSSGTGFFIGDELLATNLHVVIGCPTTEMVIKIPGKHELWSGLLVAFDEKRDIALLQVKDSKIDPIPFTDNFKQGEHIVIIGNPQGLENSVTSGMISAIRDINDITIVQTDAPINSGNSGGPILDKEGNAVGIVALKVVDVSIEGIGFGIASKHIKNLQEGKSGFWIKARPKGLMEKLFGFMGKDETKYTDKVPKVDPPPKNPRSVKDGCISGNCVNGVGTLLFDGYKYVGQFKNGKFHGQGAYYYPDGAFYVGDFEYDSFNGWGTKVSAEGGIETGLWRNDKFMGKRLR